MKLLITTYPNDGRKLKQFITMLLKKKLIACANILNYAKSYYIWEGKIKKDEEKLIILKFPKEKENELYDCVKKFHPYQIPEILTINPDKINDEYLNWVKETTK